MCCRIQEFNQYGKNLPSWGGNQYHTGTTSNWTDWLQPESVQAGYEDCTFVSTGIEPGQKLYVDQVHFSKMGTGILAKALKGIIEATIPTTHRSPVIDQPSPNGHIDQPPANGHKKHPSAYRRLSYNNAGYVRNGKPTKNNSGFATGHKTNTRNSSSPRGHHPTSEETAVEPGIYHVNLLLVMTCCCHLWLGHMVLGRHCCQPWQIVCMAWVLYWQWQWPVTYMVPGPRPCQHWLSG